MDIVNGCDGGGLRTSSQANASRCGRQPLAMIIVHGTLEAIEQITTSRTLFGLNGVRFVCLVQYALPVHTPLGCLAPGTGCIGQASSARNGLGTWGTRLHIHIVIDNIVGPGQLDSLVLVTRLGTYRESGNVLDEEKIGHQSTGGQAERKVGRIESGVVHDQAIGRRSD